jgi:nitrite reductase/ring-hydroxylating ferredoxin subunit
MNSEINSLEGYQRICSIKELKENIGQRFMVNNVEIAVFLINQKVHVLNNICPHQHSALIYDGFIENEFVVCPAHGWMFNLETGKTPDGSKGLDTYESIIVEDEIYVKVEEKKYSW